ncbi:hypothetical protein JCM31826_10130 [Thermaurantimonas aggregans]|uniref:Uncharacterized protein n=2 Tax=Thermaurantimonas aggregans TaxID=2173829 RepID=A0A401XKN0_9FLAO|nr:hypothetical protein JCM31826_10130 [Thermaurantimonas aggregans]
MIYINCIYSQKAKNHFGITSDLGLYTAPSLGNTDLYNNDFELIQFLFRYGIEYQRHISSKVKWVANIHRFVANNTGYFNQVISNEIQRINVDVTYYAWSGAVGLFTPINKRINRFRLYTGGFYRFHKFSSIRNNVIDIEVNTFTYRDSMHEISLGFLSTYALSKYQKSEGFSINFGLFAAGSMISSEFETYNKNLLINIHLKTSLVYDF